VKYPPRLTENLPQSKQQEKSNNAPTPKQENNTTAYSSETTPATTSSSRINDPTVLNVLADLELNGKSQSVINGTRKALNLISTKTQLNNPQEVRTQILKLKTGDAYKRLIADAYTRYAKYYKLTQWERPKFTITSKEITVPTTEKTKLIIASAKKPLSTKLMTSYRTGVRPVELCNLKVKDYDRATQTLHPKTAKHGAPRQIKVPNDLAQLLTEHIDKNNLTQEDYIFGGTPEKYTSSFQRFKKTLAKRLNDPTILKIRLYDIRHKFCMDTAAKFPSDPYRVMYLMGHKHFQTTEHYLHIQQYVENMDSQNYDVKTARTPEEAQKLIEIGYTKEDEIDGIHIYKKRK